MDQIDFRKALFSAGAGAAYEYWNSSSFNSPMSAAVRGGMVSVGTDVMGNFLNFEEGNVLMNAMLAGALNGAWGRMQSSNSNLTKDILIGAVREAAVNFVSDALEERGGVPGMLQHGINLV